MGLGHTLTIFWRKGNALTLDIQISPSLLPTADSLCRVYTVALTPSTDSSRTARQLALEFLRFSSSCFSVCSGVIVLVCH
jgi:hypothetical protein